MPRFIPQSCVKHFPAQNGAFCRGSFLTIMEKFRLDCRPALVTGSESFALTGRAALVTAGGRGIGRAGALALAQAGADVWLAARTRDEIEQAAAEIRAASGKAHAAVCDVTKSEEVTKLVTSIP